MSALLNSRLTPTQRAEAEAADRAELLRDLAIQERARPALVADAAEEHVLSDMDTYSDWLTSHCIGASVDHTRIVSVPRSAESLLRFVEALDIPQLLALSLYPRANARAAACDALRYRYLAASGDYIARMQEELA